MGKSLSLKELVTVLTELRLASMKISIDSTEESIKALMKKYDMLFLGDKLNTIYSHELRHSLQNYFGLQVDNDELNKLIPEACEALGMDCEPLVKLSDLGKRTDTHCYQVTLW